MIHQTENDELPPLMSTIYEENRLQMGRSSDSVISKKLGSFKPWQLYPEEVSLNRHLGFSRIY